MAFTMEPGYFLPDLSEEKKQGNTSSKSQSKQWTFLNDTVEATNATCRNDYCVSDEEYLDMIIAYIFPTPYEWLLVCTYAVLFIVGLVGNSLVCWAVWRNHSMRTVTNYFIVNLAIADILVVLLCMPPTVLGDVTETWYLGSVMCKVVLYMQGVSVCVSVLTLCCISIERYYAICHPLSFRSTPTRAKILIIVIWSISLSIVIPELIVLDTFQKLPGELTILLTSCRPTWDYQAGYQLFLICAMYVLPFLLMGFTYTQIARTLWSNSIPTESSSDQLKPKDGKTSCETQLQSRKKAAKMLIAVVIMFGVCYLPVHLLNILRYAGALEGVTWAGYFALIAHWMCYFNSAINPVIYNFMSAKFRKEFQLVCGCCSKHKETNISRHNKHQRVAHGMYAYRYTNSLQQHRIGQTASQLTRLPC